MKTALAPWLFMGMATLLCILGVISKSPKAPEIQPGRYAFTTSNSGIYRLDTATGRIDVIVLKDGALREIEVAPAQVPPKPSSDR